MIFVMRLNMLLLVLTSYLTMLCAFHAPPTDQRKLVLKMFDENRSKQGKFQVISPSDVNSLFNIKHRNIKVNKEEKNSAVATDLLDPVDQNTSNKDNQYNKQDKLDKVAENVSNSRTGRIQSTNRSKKATTELLDEQPTMFEEYEKKTSNERQKVTTKESTKDRIRRLYAENTGMDTKTRLKLEKIRAKRSKLLEELADIENSLGQYYRAVPIDEASTLTTNDYYNNENDEEDEDEEEEEETENEDEPNKPLIKKEDENIIKFAAFGLTNFDARPRRDQWKILKGAEMFGIESMNLVNSMSTAVMDRTLPGWESKLLNDYLTIFEDSNNENKNNNNNYIRVVKYEYTPTDQRRIKRSYPIEYAAFRRIFKNLPKDLSEEDIQDIIDNGYSDVEYIQRKYLERLKRGVQKEKMGRALLDRGIIKDYDNRLNGYSSYEKGYDSNGIYQGNYDTIDEGERSSTSSNSVRKLRDDDSDDIDDDEQSRRRRGSPMGSRDCDDCNRGGVGLLERPSKRSISQRKKNVNTMSVNSINDMYNSNELTSKSTTKSSRSSETRKNQNESNNNNNNINNNNIITNIFDKLSQWMNNNNNNLLQRNRDSKSLVEMLEARNQRELQSRTLRRFTTGFMNRLTTDWRPLTVIIISLSVITAVVQVYQQTGGDWESISSLLYHNKPPLSREIVSNFEDLQQNTNIDPYTLESINQMNDYQRSMDM